MTMRTGIGLALAAFAAVTAVALTFSFRRAEALRIDFLTMGTRAAFIFYATPELAETAGRAGIDDFERITEACNLHDPDSELSRLNAAAFEQPFRCSDLLWSILSEARQAYAFSGGAFDISVKPLMDLWGFYRRRGTEPPSETEVAAVRELVGLDKVIFDDRARTVRFTRRGMALDLGGVAKGCAVDRAAAAAVAAGIRAGVIDLGGNLRLLPEPPPGRESYRIGVTDPGAPDRVRKRVLELPGDMSLSTSGDYERFVILAGRRYGHIIDPATGVPPAPGRAVTVMAPSAFLADWLSTAVYLRGGELAWLAEAHFPGVRIMIYHQDDDDETRR